MDKDLKKWQSAKKKLNEWKKKEMELRRGVIQKLFGELEEGTKTLEQDGYKLKVSTSMNYTLEEALLPAVEEALMKLGIIPKTVITYKPKLVVRAYKSLEGQAKEIMDEAITAKLGSPSFKMEKVD